MRRTPNIRLEQLRIGGPHNTSFGAFVAGPLRIIVSTGSGWDHISVSRADRCPTWDEMDYIKRLCFRDDEIVMQLHVTNGKVNVHDFCLHLWRPQTQEEIVTEQRKWEAAGELWPYDDLRAPHSIPLPPKEFVWGAVAFDSEEESY